MSPAIAEPVATTVESDTRYSLYSTVVWSLHETLQSRARIPDLSQAGLRVREV